MAHRILLVEDTLSISMLYASILRNAGHKVVPVTSLTEARDALLPGDIEVVLLDMGLPDGNGMDLLEELGSRPDAPKVIVVTADSSVSVAVNAMRHGAFDFLLKPFEAQRLIEAVSNALAAGRDDQPAQPVTRFEGFIGGSEPMQQVYRLVQSISRSSSTVFITGESGTGKEVCASAIHNTSSRRAGPFVPLNCGAIPADLLESEVFGHLKGSFTGAINDKQGAAAAANGGTLFLDEICEMDLSLQTKLLRFLQTSTIQPVGATRAFPVDVRIICATNRDPQLEVQHGRFREDLFYRLHVIPVHLPPLRERKEDIPQIARSMLFEYAAEEGKHFTGFDAEVLEALLQHDWPGNVRQLLNVMRNIVALNDGPLVNSAMLPRDVTRPPTSPVDSGGSRPTAPAGDFEGAVAALAGLPYAKVERALIEATIALCGNSVPRAAKLLEVSPSTIYRKIEAWKKQ